MLIILVLALYEILEPGMLLCYPERNSCIIIDNVICIIVITVCLPELSFVSPG